jgi:biopolymer transport protein ExbD
MRHRRFLHAEEGMTEINISPLIDMVFILLIFFIVTTVFIEETGVEINKPEAISAVNLEKQSILIAVTAGGQVVYGGREIGVSGIRPLVRRLTQKEQVPVILQADRTAQAGLIVRVIDEAKLAGAKTVSISTEQP